VWRFSFGVFDRMNLARLDAALVFCALVASVGGVVLSIVAALTPRTEDPQAGSTAKHASRQMLLFAMLCLLVEVAVHC